MVLVTLTKEIRIMKNSLTFRGALLLVVLALITTQSCKQKQVENSPIIAMTDEVEKAPSKKTVTEEFKKYWYSGEAEISSYSLNQARYGEMRRGNAVLIYVTEPFHAIKQVKADQNNSDNIPVLKLNSTKNYLTGIYPYSIMSSSFYPVHDSQHALKVSFSSQEWCGQVYAQLNNKDLFEIKSHSYFESEGDEHLELEKTILENELWNKIRIDPNSLPTGFIEIIPSLEFIRLTHKELKSYSATATLTKENTVSTYQIMYPELERTLKINFTTSFPYTIESWSDSYKSGFGSNAKIMTSTATKRKTIKSPYWQKNSNRFLPLRDSLGL